jgi:hypothetical protein
LSRNSIAFLQKITETWVHICLPDGTETNCYRKHCSRNLIEIASSYALLVGICKRQNLNGASLRSYSARCHFVKGSLSLTSWNLSISFSRKWAPLCH